MHQFITVITSLMLLSRPLAAQPGGTRSDSLPSIQLPAPLDRVLRDYERAWRAADVAGLVALFTDDGFVLQPERAPARGRMALARVYQGQGGGDLRLRALAFGQSDSIAYIIGAYGYGKRPADMGKFTLALRRSPDGRWLIASDMDNASRVSPPAARVPPAD